MLYGVNVYIDFWGISRESIYEEYPQLQKYLGESMFKTKCQRDRFVRELDTLVLRTYDGGWTCNLEDQDEDDCVLEITDYGTFSILVYAYEFEEEFKHIKERRKGRVFSEG